MNLTSTNFIIEILKKHNFKFSKKLGQNFICNPHICPKMASYFGKDCGVIEIGPGIGTLTTELAKVCEKVISVELDKRLLPILEETLRNFNNLKIINEDILKTDLKNLIKTKFSGIKEINVCANLPYYITSPVIMKLLENKLPVNSLILMVQKEAAQRICAKPQTREIGALSLAVMYYSVPEILFDVSRNLFMPTPNVDSAVIRLKVKKPPLEEKEEKSFFKIVKVLFLNRRKTILNTLSSGLHISKEETKKILDILNLDEKLRPEHLSFNNFLNLAKAFSPQKNLS